MATQEELERERLLQQAFSQFGGDTPATPAAAPRRDVRAERLAEEAATTPIPLPRTQPVAAPVQPIPGSREILLAQQERARQNTLAQQKLAERQSKSINNRPRNKFLKENQSFMDAFTNPSEAQRAFAFNAGLALLSSNGTNNLSQRIGQALGSGMQGMQATRQAELDAVQKANESEMKLLQMQQQGIGQEMGFTSDLAAMDAAAAQAASDRLASAQQQANKDRDYELDLLKFQTPETVAPGTIEKRQLRRRDLQTELTNLKAADQPDLVAIERANQEIAEINSALSPKSYFDPVRNVMVYPSKGGSKPTQLTKQTIDLTGSIAGASQIAKQGMNLVYDPIQDEIFGRIQNFPTIAGAYESIRALGDPEISQFIEAKNRFRVSAMLPFARTLAPVTDIDAAKLEKTKGLLEAGDRNAQIKEWEGKSLPDLAQLIFDSNINYKVGDTGGEEGGVYGPQVAAQNQLIFAESSLNGALEGQGYTADQSMAERNERTDRLLEMYPSTGVSRNLSGMDGVYSYKGRVVSQNFINKISKGYGLTPADFIKYSEISAY